MKNTNPVKMLGAFALVLLVFGVTDGRIMSKCELKAKLDAAQFQQITAMGEKIPVKNLIARLVCMANSTAFNTSFIKVITGDKQQKRSVPAQAPSKAPPQPPAHDASKAPPRAPSSKAPPHAPSSKSPPRAPSSKAPPRAPSSKSPPRAPSSKAPPHDASKAPPHNPSKAPPHDASKAPPRNASKAPPHNESEAPSHEASRGPPHAQPSKAPPHNASKAPPSRVPPQVPSSRAPPKNDQEGHTKAAQSFRNETQHPQHPQPTAAAQAMERRYGVFQLSDRLACDSGLVPSRNLCKISCNALIDDDITNDIACLKTLMNSTAEMLLVKECRFVVPDKFFANCA